MTISASQPDDPYDSPPPKALIQEYGEARSRGEMQALRLRPEELSELEPADMEPGMILEVDDWTLVASRSGGIVYSWFCLLDRGRGDADGAIRALGSAVAIERYRGVVIDLPEVTWEGDVARVSLMFVPPGQSFVEQLSFAERLLTRVLDVADMEPSRATRQPGAL